MDILGNMDLPMVGNKTHDEIKTVRFTCNFY